jgi:hypothetical protein
MGVQPALSGFHAQIVAIAERPTPRVTAHHLPLALLRVLRTVPSSERPMFRHRDIESRQATCQPSRQTAAALVSSCKLWQSVPHQPQHPTHGHYN